MLTNNFIHHNDNDVNSSFGGLSLKPTLSSKVQFNTIVDNKSNQGAASAGSVFCDVSGFVADGNIIFRNTDGSSAVTQTFGNFTYGNSLIASASASDNMRNSSIRTPSHSIIGSQRPRPRRFVMPPAAVRSWIMTAISAHFHQELLVTSAPRNTIHDTIYDGLCSVETWQRDRQEQASLRR